MVSLLLYTLTLPVLPRTRSHGARFAPEMFEKRKKISRKSASLPCLENLSVLVS
jgi:hypothetical protein